MTAAPNIYRYLDYRPFLRDFYSHRKSTTGLSYRALSRKAGFSSPNFFKLVIDGKRNLGVASVPNVAHACRLDSRARDYLHELVLLKRATSAEQRLEALGRLTSFEERVALFPLEREAGEYFARWWVPVVRELSAVEGFRADPAWVAACLQGRVTEAQAGSALSTLEKLGLMHGDDRAAHNRWVTSGDELQTTAMQRYHQQLLAVAGRAIDDVTPERRDISAITITGDADTFAEAKRMVQRFRKELLALERRSQGRSEVYQFCLQLYPVATVEGGESR